MNTVKVYLVDDEPSVTEAIVWLLESVKITALAFSSANLFLKTMDHEKGPACAVIDLRMPEMSGLELQQRLNETRHKNMPIIFLTAHGDVPAAVSAIQAGALDFLQKPFNPNTFLEKVRQAMRLAKETHERTQKIKQLNECIETLSPREYEVLEGLLAGHTSKEIARQLEISPKTVDVHRSNVLRKTGAHTSLELMRALSELR